MIIVFPNSILFKFKQQTRGQTRDNSTKDVEIMALLKYLSNFWRTLKMSLINCEISLMLAWSKNCYLKRLLYSQMHRADKYSQHSSIIWPVWLND